MVALEGNLSLRIPYPPPPPTLTSYVLHLPSRVRSRTAGRGRCPMGRTFPLVSLFSFVWQSSWLSAGLSFSSVLLIWIRIGFGFKCQKLQNVGHHLVAQYTYVATVNNVPYWTKCCHTSLRPKNFCIANCFYFRIYTHTVFHVASSWARVLSS